MVTNTVYVRILLLAQPFRPQNTNQWPSYRLRQPGQDTKPGQVFQHVASLRKACPMQNHMRCCPSYYPAYDMIDVSVASCNLLPRLRLEPVPQLDP